MVTFTSYGRVRFGLSKDGNMIDSKAWTVTNNGPVYCVYDNNSKLIESFRRQWVLSTWIHAFWKNDN